MQIIPNQLEDEKCSIKRKYFTDLSSIPLDYSLFNLQYNVVEDMHKLTSSTDSSRSIPLDIPKPKYCLNGDLDFSTNRIHFPDVSNSFLASKDTTDIYFHNDELIPFQKDMELIFVIDDI